MHFVLIHGSWHGAWCWEKLIPFLLEGNNKVTTLELPGSGERFNEIDAVTLPLLVDELRQFLEQQRTKVTLIVHSFSGLLIAQLAEDFYDKINHIFYLTAWLPRDGYSLIDMALEYNNSELPSIFIIPQKPNWTALDPEGAKSIFYHDCSLEDQLFASGRIKPKNSLPDRTTLVEVKSKKALAQSSYILCTEDKVIKPASQLDMATRFGFKEEQIVHFPSGHSPFLSQPERLAEVILSKLS
jgi:pimeloyl-ACP methyl ester carboxylesterase